jgi:hypothetical protein
VAHGVYWSCFTVSLMVCYPPLLVCSLIPAGNVLGRGLADGRDAARDDVVRLKGWTRRKVHRAAEQLPYVGSAVPQAAGA